MDAAQLASMIRDRSVAGVVEAVSGMIREGALAPGERLPTVRAIAAELGVGVATISRAWAQLADAGMIETRGRAGSFVPLLERRHAVRFFRYSRHGEFRLDLSTGMPDPALLPPIQSALERVKEVPHPSSYIAPPVVPKLEEQIRRRLPYPAEALTVVDGALDALDRLLGPRVRLGDRVAVADPGFPPIFDLIEEHGGVAVPVEIDDEGMVPDSLARALRQRPVGVVIQPRAQNPTGVSMTERRAKELAEVIARSGAWVIEDDHSGMISSSPLVSIGAHLPERVLHITSFSKSHGPDFRIASIAGPSAALAELVDRRRLGPAWTSRFLQSLLAELLGDPEVERLVSEARSVYGQRRAKLAAAMAEHGFTTTGSDGLNLWVAVPDEQAALVMLAARGIAVAPGRPFQLRPTFEGHIRVTTGSTDADLTELAEILSS
ncbi:MAG TPA: aminotransferase class I/II-fold pyridoxal phosphate-dependent enzyme [Acidimicrobiia bacterium]